MINEDDFEVRIKEIKKDTKDIFTENIPNEYLVKFHKLIKKCFKKLDIIVKGSRALNKYLKYQIYKKEELINVDYDIYSLNYKSDLDYITKFFKKEGLSYIRAKVLDFKSDISRLSLYSVPIIDIEEIDKETYNNLKFKEFDGIKYIHPEFYKIDLYSILAQPTLVNMSVYEKAYKRLDLVESNFKYNSKIKIKESSTKNKNIDYVLSILNDNTIIIGNYSYNKLLKTNIEIKYLELLTEDLFYYVNKLKKKYGNRIYYKKFKQVHYIMGNYIMIELDRKPLVLLWHLRNNTSYTIKDNNKICSRYYLRFYYNFLSFFNYLNSFFMNKDYYNALLKNITIISLPKLKSIGNINYDIIEQLDNIKTRKINSFYQYNSERNIIKYSKTNPSRKTVKR